MELDSFQSDQCSQKAHYRSIDCKSHTVHKCIDSKLIGVETINFLETFNSGEKHIVNET